MAKTYIFSNYKFNNIHMILLIVIAFIVLLMMIRHNNINDIVEGFNSSSCPSNGNCFGSMESCTNAVRYANCNNKITCVEATMTDKEVGSQGKCIGYDPEKAQYYNKGNFVAIDSCKDGDGFMYYDGGGASDSQDKYKTTNPNMNQESLTTKQFSGDCSNWRTCQLGCVSIKGSGTSNIVSCSGDCASCFNNTAKIELESGEKINISDAKIGDKILCYNSKKEFVYSPIIFIPHEKNEDKYTFSKITTKNNIELLMTECHYIPVYNENDNCNNIIIKKAKDLLINDIILTKNNKDSIINIEKVEDTGIFTVITNEEFIVVNDIVASPFGSNIPHYLTNQFYNILRTLYKINPNINKSQNLRKTLDYIGNFITMNYSS